MASGGIDRRRERVEPLAPGASVCLPVNMTLVEDPEPDLSESRASPMFAASLRYQWELEIPLSGYQQPVLRRSRKDVRAYQGRT